MSPMTDEKQTFRVTLANQQGEENISAVRMVVTPTGDLLLVNDSPTAPHTNQVVAVYPSGEYIRAVRQGSQQ